MMVEITDWVPVGTAMRLRTETIDVMVAEQADGRLTIALEPRGEAVLTEPSVQAAGSGAFLIDTAGTVRPQLTEAL